MRIVAGQLRGRPIPPHRCLAAIRLTSARLKEAVFSLLGADLDHRSFLDLCAGSGQIGLEAYSRGAVVTLNEPDPRRWTRIQALVRAWSLQGVALYRMRAQGLLPVLATAGQRFDVVYVDPPYEARHRGLPLAAALLEQLGRTPVLNSGGLVLVQHPAAMALPEATGTLVLRQRRPYGTTHLSLYAPASCQPATQPSQGA